MDGAKVTALFGQRAIGDLSLMEMVLATIVGRKQVADDRELASAVSDICRREVGTTELKSLAGRLVVVGVLSAEGSIFERTLTRNGFDVLRHSHECILRMLDNNSGLIVAGAMVGLFDNWTKEP